MKKSTKRVITAVAVLLGGLVLIIGAFLAITMRLGPLPFGIGGSSGLKFKQWESFEEAKIFFGDKFLYPTLPDWASDYEISAHSVYIRGERVRLRNFAYLQVSAKTLLYDDSSLHVNYYLHDTKQGRFFDNITFHVYGMNFGYSPSYWYNPELFTEEINNVSVKFAVMPLQARVLFEIGNIQYGIMINTEAGWDIPREDIPDSEFSHVEEEILISLREMAQSIISQIQEG
jgi:hypothetical protein